MDSYAVRVSPAILVVAMLSASLVGGCGAGATPAASSVTVAPATAEASLGPAAEAPSAPRPTVVASPVADSDEALLEALADLWSRPYDAAAVEALYAPTAVFRDTIAGEIAGGVDAIGAKVKRYADLGFRVENTSPSIRQDDVLAVFQQLGSRDETTPGLAVVKLVDGKVQAMWEYPAGSSPVTASPGPAADDKALMADVNAVWAGTPDPAAVEALYAPDATFHDTIEGKTYAGVEAIREKAEANAAAGMKCEQTSPSIRQGDFVAVFHRFDAGFAVPVLAVFELRDGKVINQWAYPAR